VTIKEVMDGVSLYCVTREKRVTLREGLQCAIDEGGSVGDFDTGLRNRIEAGGLTEEELEVLEMLRVEITTLNEPAEQVEKHGKEKPRGKSQLR
jgi:hypothetical protein